MQNSQLVVLLSNWVPQVISTALRFIMFTQWKEEYSGIEKHIVLLTNMTVKVNIMYIP